MTNTGRVAVGLVMLMSSALGYFTGVGVEGKKAERLIEVEKRQELFEKFCVRRGAVEFALQERLVDNYLASCMDLVAIQAMDKVDKAEEKNRAYLDVRVRDWTWENRKAREFCGDLFHQFNGYNLQLAVAKEGIDAFNIDCYSLGAEFSDQQ